MRVDHLATNVANVGATAWQRKRWVTWLATGLLLACGAWQARAQPVAVVIDGGGVARVFATSGTRTVETLELLNAGTRLQVDSVAQIVVLYLLTGVEFSFTGPGVIEVRSSQLVALSGNPPTVRLPTAGKEIRLRTQRTAQGGVVLRSVSADTSEPAAQAGSVEVDSRRPSADAPLASWVAYALWLEEMNASVEARAVWQRIAVERPMDKAIAKRAL
jgi:hypothetical protein